MFILESLKDMVFFVELLDLFFGECSVNLSDTNLQKVDGWIR